MWLRALGLGGLCAVQQPLRCSVLGVLAMLWVLLATGCCIRQAALKQHQHHAVGQLHLVQAQG